MITKQAYTLLIINFDNIISTPREAKLVGKDVIQGSRNIDFLSGFAREFLNDFGV